MTDAEKALVKQALHDFVDNTIPQLIEAEEARLPLAYQGLVRMVVGVLLPQLKPMIDKKIDGI